MGSRGWERLKSRPLKTIFRNITDFIEGKGYLGDLDDFMEVKFHDLVLSSIVFQVLVAF